MQVLFVRDVMYSEMFRFPEPEGDYVYRSEGEVGFLQIEGTRPIVYFDGDAGYIYPDDSYLPLPPLGEII